MGSRTTQAASPLLPGAERVLLPRRAAVGVLTAAFALSLTACGVAQPSERSGSDGVGGSESTAASPSPAETGQPTSSSASGETKETDMRIEITVDGETFQATLDESAASRDLAAQLPVTLEMRDHGSVEKTGPLPAPLSLDGQPDGADPDVGDVGYYAPGNDFVLYYGDQSHFSGIVLLGRMDEGAAERLSRLDGSITATVDVAE